MEPVVAAVLLPLTIAWELLLTLKLELLGATTVPFLLTRSASFPIPGFLIRIYLWYLLPLVGTSSPGTQNLR